MKFLRLKADNYKGQDQGTGLFMHVIKDDVVKVSDEKGVQLMKDFPDEWVTADEKAFVEAGAGRDGRVKAARIKAEQSEKQRAAQEKEMARAGAGGGGDDDDEK